MADNDYLGNIQSQRLNQQWSNSMAWSTPSWMQGGFKQGTPQGGGSTFRAPNAGVRQSWDGAEMRDIRTRPTDWKGAIDLYKDSLEEAEDDGSSSSGPATTPSSPASRPRRTPAGTRTPAGGGTPTTTPSTTPTGGGTPSTTPTGTTPTGTTTPTGSATPAGRPRPRWMPRFTPTPVQQQQQQQDGPNPLLSGYQGLESRATATNARRQYEEAFAPSNAPTSVDLTKGIGAINQNLAKWKSPAPALPSKPLVPPAPGVQPFGQPSGTPAFPAPGTPPPARPPLTDLQQKAIAGVQQMRQQRQNPSATGSTPASGSRAQNRSAKPSRIGNFGQNRIKTNLAPFT
jgi:hypothetical protein